MSVVFPCVCVCVGGEKPGLVIVLNLNRISSAV